MIYSTVARLIDYALEKGLIQPNERIWAQNAILEVMELESFESYGSVNGENLMLHELLDELLRSAINRGLISDSITQRDILDTKLMGRLTPRPAQVIDKFNEKYKKSFESATDWYYQFSQDTNYIRRDRISKDMKWAADTEYGLIDITINLSKPEKDPKAIAAARNSSSGAYPACQLCIENEGYAGRMDHPARGNHRIIPININGGSWFLQYSPYVYYNEHCIILNSEHVPMKIDRDCFMKLLDFVRQFPHYFVGSNADLPIVGGSILSHDHFQGGRYTFPMERAPVDTPVTFENYPDITGGIVKWPLSVLRIISADSLRLAELADHILGKWRGYSDKEAFIFAETDGEPHNTITPIARMRDGRYELDLVFRNNITTDKYPLGLYHAHQEHHHIKKENIGLIEVMGLAVLPSRLLGELKTLADALINKKDLLSDVHTAEHADWAESLRGKYEFNKDNAFEILQREVGLVFCEILEQCGVFERTASGQRAFKRFLKTL